MWVCIGCHTEFPEFPEFTGGVGANIDSFGLHLTCPVCGRSNGLSSLGEDDGGFLHLGQIDELE